MSKVLKKQAVITSLIIFVLTVALTGAACFLYKKNVGEIIQILVMTSLFSLFLAFVFDYGFIDKQFDYDNNEHPLRFLLIYVISLFLALLFPFIDRGGWIFVCLAIDLALLSNILTGLFAVSGLIMLSTVLSGSNNIFTYLVYFFACLIGIFVFRNIDEKFKVGPSIFISQLCLIVFETAGFIFLENKVLEAEQFIYPIVNVVLNTVVLVIMLKSFNEKILDKYRNKYLELNDQEYKALTALKTISKEEYLRSIHTAYLTERIANEAGMDVNVAKNLAYYHRIKHAFGFTMEQLEEFLAENDFPPKAAETVLRFSDREKTLSSREESVVFLADKFISMLMLVFEKDSKADINIPEIIDSLMNKPVIDEVLAESDLSRKDFNIVKNIMKKEVLYYDFLR